MSKGIGLLLRLMFVWLGSVSLSCQAQGLQSLFDDGAFDEAFESVQKMESENLRAQMLATYYTFVGRQDLVYGIQPALPLADQCAEEKNVSFSSAEQWVEAALANYKVVMFNENHFHLAARAWVLGSLKSFKEQGFTHIGFEAFLPGQIKPEEGFYTYEPVFASLIEEARQLGFEVFGYELGEQVPEGQSSFDMREQTQAENIAAIVDRSDPSARFLIFAGWRHIAKQAVGEANRLWMAARFMQLTGIEPFSIDLVSCVYAGHQNTRPEKGKVAFDSDGQPVVVGSFNSLVDGQLHLPLVKSVGFYRQVLGEPVSIPESLRNVNEPRLIRAFVENGTNSSVPYDQVLLFAGEHHPLYLTSGKTYELISTDGKGNIRGRKTIVVP